MHRSTPLFDNAAKRQHFVGPPLAVPKRVVQGHCLNAQFLQRQFLHAAGVQAMSLAPVPQAQRQLVKAIVVGLHVLKLGQPPRSQHANCPCCVPANPQPLATQFLESSRAGPTALAALPSSFSMSHIYSQPMLAASISSPASTQSNPSTCIRTTTCFLFGGVHS